MESNKNEDVTIMYKWFLLRSNCLTGLLSSETIDWTHAGLNMPSLLLNCFLKVIPIHRNKRKNSPSVDVTVSDLR